MKIKTKFEEKSQSIFSDRAPTLVFFGDSVTEGCFEVYKTGGRAIDTVRDYESVYHNQLKKLLNEKYPNVPCNIINSGISGDNANQATSRIERDVLSYKPDLTVVAFGLNDSSAGIDSLSLYINSLKRIFTEIAASGSEIIYLTANMMCQRVSESLTDDFLIEIAVKIAQIQNDGVLKKYFESGKELAKSMNVKVCDCYSEWEKLAEAGKDTDALLSNAINHPTRAMHKLFAEKLYELVTE